jgi:nucleoside-diphosphate kinase
MSEKLRPDFQFIDARKALTPESDPLYQHSLVIVNPLGVARGLIGEVISRFENRMLNIEAAQITQIDITQARELYKVHEGKFFHGDLIKTITHGPSAIFVVGGMSAIAVIRHMVGLTRPQEANMGTIRGDLGSPFGEDPFGGSNNLIHASDALENAKNEIKIFFPRFAEKTSR